ncbi:MAG: ABC-2 transporter permease [Bacilli bacterium]
MLFLWKYEFIKIWRGTDGTSKFLIFSWLILGVMYSSNTPPGFLGILYVSLAWMYFFSQLEFTKADFEMTLPITNREWIVAKYLLVLSWWCFFVVIITFFRGLTADEIEHKWYVLTVFGVSLVVSVLLFVMLSSNKIHRFMIVAASGLLFVIGKVGWNWDIYDTGIFAHKLIVLTLSILCFLISFLGSLSIHKDDVEVSCR